MIGPRVTRVNVESTVSTHGNYDVPSGSGAQIRTVPIAKINRIFVVFNENITNANTGTVSVVSANGGGSYPISSVTTTANNVLITLTNPITSRDQLIVTVSDSVTDLAGNAIDSEWTNPTNVDAMSAQPFPSGNGSPGSPAGAFKFYITVLPGDYSRNSVVSHRLRDMAR